MCFAESDKNRCMRVNVSVNMSKGIAIILMVLAHTNFSKAGVDVINMFHMPLFFFFSGYCFKESYLLNVKSFVWKRIKGAYVPFVTWSLLFLLLHNVFVHIHIYDVIYNSTGIYSAGDICRRAMTIVFTMNETEQLLGGYWFLHSYLLAAFISFFVIYLSFPFQTKKNIVILATACVFLLGCWLMLFFRVRVPYYVEAKELLATFFMLAGYLYKQTSWHFERYVWAVAPICFLILFVGMHFGKCSMLTLTATKMLWYAISAIAGVFLVFSICQLISSVKIFEVSLSYVGTKTLGILTWHFLCFKFVSWILILYYHLPIDRLSEFPVVTEYSSQGWWMLYLVAGLLLPIVIDNSISIVSQKVKEKVHAVR